MAHVLLVSAAALTRFAQPAGGFLFRPVSPFGEIGFHLFTDSLSNILLLSSAPL